MNRRIVDRLYAATEEDLLFGIGVLTLGDQKPAAYIHIHYRNWTREKLALVRDAFQAGLAVTWSAPTAGFRDLHISTHERIAIQADHDGYTSLLRAPAWDAHLVRIEEQVAHYFEADQKRCGGFLLVLQTADLEFSSAVSLNGKAQLGPIRRCTFAIPDNPTTRS